MPVRNNQVETCLNESERMKAWVVLYKGLLHVEFPWDESALPEDSPTGGVLLAITHQMVIKALRKMKCG